MWCKTTKNDKKTNELYNNEHESADSCENRHLVDHRSVPPGARLALATLQLVLPVSCGFFRPHDSNAALHLISPGTLRALSGASRSGQAAQTAV